MTAQPGQHGGARPGAGRKKGPAGDAAKRFAEARARKESALADLREMQAAQLRGELVTVEIVAERWAAILATVRARLLAIPSQAAGQLGATATPAEVEKIVRSAIYEALTQLAEAPTYEQ